MATGETPEPTEEERDAPLERREEEDAQRYPSHEDPERVIDPDGGGEEREAPERDGE
jgi:hypothetical protein